MITVIHGNDGVSSRKFYSDKKSSNSLSFDAENINLVELSQVLQGASLFKSDNKIFIENFFSKKAMRNAEEIAELLKGDQNNEVFIYSDKEVPTKSLSSLPKHEALLFKIKENIFYFLDGLRPDSVQNVRKFREVIAASDVEIVFYMIIRQFRLLLSVSDGKGKIDEAKRLQDWQQEKLQRQARLFGPENLRKIYKKLYIIDKEQKTGMTPLSLTQTIDFLMLEI